MGVRLTTGVRPYSVGESRPVSVWALCTERLQGLLRSDAARFYLLGVTIVRLSWQLRLRLQDEHERISLARSAVVSALRTEE